MDENLHVSPHGSNTMLAAYPLEVAQKIAVDICYKLQPFCEKINIAGSVRRKKPEVKDIEIVCVPQQETQYDMFGTPFTSGRSTGFRDVVLSLGEIIKGGTNGKYIQIKLPQGINLDLFIPDDFDYYRQYAIRTGSADYAAKVIASGWRLLKLFVFRLPELWVFDIKPVIKVYRVGC